MATYVLKNTYVRFLVLKKKKSLMGVSFVIAVHFLLLLLLLFRPLNDKKKSNCCEN